MVVLAAPPQKGDAGLGHLPLVVDLPDDREEKNDDIPRGATRTRSDRAVLAATYESNERRGMATLHGYPSK